RIGTESGSSSTQLFQAELPIDMVPRHSCDTLRSVCPNWMYSMRGPQSYQPGDLIAFLKNAVLWPIQSCAFFSLRNRSINSREFGVAVLFSSFGIRCSVRSSA